MERDRAVELECPVASGGLGHGEHLAGERALVGGVFLFAVDADLGGGGDQRDADHAALGAIRFGITEGPDEVAVTGDGDGAVGFGCASVVGALDGAAGGLRVGDEADAFTGLAADGAEGDSCGGRGEQGDQGCCGEGVGDALHIRFRVPLRDGRVNPNQKEKRHLHLDF